jgi:putative transposase
VKKRFSEEQIIGFLREAEAGMPIKDLCRRHGFSEASYYLWRSKFGGMNVSDATRLKDLSAVPNLADALLLETVGETFGVGAHGNLGWLHRRNEGVVDAGSIQIRAAD